MLGWTLLICVAFVVVFRIFGESVSQSSNLIKIFPHAHHPRQFSGDSILSVWTVFLSSFYLVSFSFFLIYVAVWHYKNSLIFYTTFSGDWNVLLTIEAFYFGPQYSCYCHKSPAIWTSTLKEWILPTAKFYIKICLRFYTFEPFMLTDVILQLLYEIFNVKYLFSCNILSSFYISKCEKSNKKIFGQWDKHTSLIIIAKV